MTGAVGEMAMQAKPSTLTILGVRWCADEHLTKNVANSQCFRWVEGAHRPMSTLDILVSP